MQPYLINYYRALRSHFGGMSSRNVGRMPPAYGGVEVVMVNKSNKFKRVESGEYETVSSVSREEIIQFAKYLIAQSFRKRTNVLTSPQKVREYLSLHLAEELNEQFWVLYLCNRHRVITHERVFHGTIDCSAVYPRVIVQRALQHNAAALLFAHNHPSGVAEPSDTDVKLTKKLMEALSLVDIRVLDHLVVGKEEIVSLAERGLM